MQVYDMNDVRIDYLTTGSDVSSPTSNVWYQLTRTGASGTMPWARSMDFRWGWNAGGSHTGNDYYLDDMTVTGYQMTQEADTTYNFNPGAEGWYASSGSPALDPTGGVGGTQCWAGSTTQVHGIYGTVVWFEIEREFPAGLILSPTETTTHYVQFEGAADTDAGVTLLADFYFYDESDNLITSSTGRTVGSADGTFYTEQITTVDNSDQPTDDIIYKIKIGIYVDDPTFSGSIYLDDARIVGFNVLALPSDGGASLYHVTTPNGAAAWTDISPITDMAPQYPDAFGVDPVNPNRFVCVAESHDNATKKVYESTDAGSNWTEISSNTQNWRGLSFMDDIFLRWGVGSMDFTTDGVSDQGDSQLGTWSTTIGTVGEILGVKVLL
jgi:hypothetical protein